MNTLNILLFGVGGDYEGDGDRGFKDFPVASYIIFLAFMIIVVILFNNLLVRLLCIINTM